MRLLSAIAPRPEYGPFQRGRDSVAEIIATVTDIAALAPAEQHQHFGGLVAAYPAAAFVDALLCIANGFAPMTAHQLRAPFIGGKT